MYYFSQGCACVCRSVTCLEAGMLWGFCSFGIWTDTRQLICCLLVSPTCWSLEVCLHIVIPSNKCIDVTVHTTCGRWHAVPSETRTTFLGPWLYYSTKILFLRTDVTPALCIISIKITPFYPELVCSILHSEYWWCDIFIIYFLIVCDLNWYLTLNCLGPLAFVSEEILN